jgi:hypothetical protein
VYGSISTMASWPVVPWESAELGRSAVSTFGLPWRQKDGSPGSGSYQAPVDSCTTPGRTSSVSATPARQLPRSLKMRTHERSLMPRAAASSGCIATGSRPQILPSWL